MKQHLHKVAGFIILNSLLWANNGPAYAASFDCNRAETARERFICSKPELSELDSQLGHLYSEKKSLLSPQGAQLLEKSELGWLRFLSMVCPLNVPITNSNTRREPLTCIKRQYQFRLDELAKVGQIFGPYRFNRIDLYAAQSVADPTDTTGVNEGFLTKHVAYPQIDNANSINTQNWNRQQTLKLPQESGCDNFEDYDSDYELGYANANFISLLRTSDIYCHGNAHGLFGSENQNHFITQAQRQLKAEDVFETDSQWQTKLQSLFWEKLTDQGWIAAGPKQQEVESEIKSIVISPDRWLFTQQGIRVNFSAYEGGVLRVYTATNHS